MPGRHLTIDVLGPFFGVRGNRLVSITADRPGAIALEGLTWPTKVAANHFRADASFLTGPEYRGAKNVDVSLRSGAKQIHIGLSVRF